MYGPLGLASGLGGMDAFLLRLPGDGVDDQPVKGLPVVRLSEQEGIILSVVDRRNCLEIDF